MSGEPLIALGILETNEAGAGASLDLNSAAFSFSSLRFDGLDECPPKRFASDPFLRRLSLLGVLRRFRKLCARLIVRARAEGLGSSTAFAFEPKSSSCELPVDAENLDGGSVGMGR